MIKELDNIIYFENDYITYGKSWKKDLIKLIIKGHGKVVIAGGFPVSDMFVMHMRYGNISTLLDALSLLVKSDYFNKKFTISDIPDIPMYPGKLFNPFARLIYMSNFDLFLFKKCFKTKNVTDLNSFGIYKNLLNSVCRTDNELALWVNSLNFLKYKSNVYNIVHLYCGYEVL